VRLRSCRLTMERKPRVGADVDGRDATHPEIRGGPLGYLWPSDCETLMRCPTVGSAVPPQTGLPSASSSATALADRNAAVRTRSP